MIQNIPILDFHCHFPVKGDWFPSYGKIEKVEFDTTGARDYHDQWRKAFNFPIPDPPQDDKTMVKLWLDDMDAKKVERVAWVSGGGNKRLKNIVNLAPDRFIGFAHHHPDVKDAVEQLEIAFRDYNLRGYKLLGPYIDTNLSDKKYYPLWEICEKYNRPVLIHFGLLGAAGGLPNGENISPMSIAKISRAFPNVNFVVPHFGCTHMQDLLQLCWTRPNIWVDTSGSNQWIRWMPYKLTLEDVIRKYVETIGPGRIIFATDSSWMPRGFAYIYLEEQNKAFRFVGLNDDDMHKVLHKNSELLLGL